MKLPIKTRRGDIHAKPFRHFISSFNKSWTKSLPELVSHFSIIGNDMAIIVPSEKS